MGRRERGATRPPADRHRAGDVGRRNGCRKAGTRPDRPRRAPTDRRTTTDRPADGGGRTPDDATPSHWRRLRPGRRREPTRRRHHDDGPGAARQPTDFRVSSAEGGGRRAGGKRGARTGTGDHTRDKRSQHAHRAGREREDPEQVYSLAGRQPGRLRANRDTRRLGSTWTQVGLTAAALERVREPSQRAPAPSR